jgi:hypothetical protein
MYAATQDQINELKHITEQVVAAQQQQKNVYLTPMHETSTQGAEPLPQFQPLIGYPSRNDFQYQDHLNFLDAGQQQQQQQQQQFLTETDFANLLNYGTMNVNARLPAANLVLPSDQISQRQRENEKILEQAQRDLLAQQELQQQYTTPQAAYSQHQNAVAEHLSAASQQPFQIYVPDDEYSNDKVSHKHFLKIYIFENLECQICSNSSNGELM